MGTIVAILNPKGGCGKTTISTNLARALGATGDRVLIVDSDPQGTARDWRQMQPENDMLPIVVGMDRAAMLRDLEDLRTNFQWIVIDGAARLVELTAGAVRIADIVLIPVQPSAFDIWGAASLVELVRARQMVGGGRPVGVFVASRQVARTRLALSLREALEADLPVLPGGIAQRQIYADAGSRGVTVFDYEAQNASDVVAKRKAQGEIMAIVDEVKRIADTMGVSER